ncbi:hypothetical protein [Italian clover phyllody phytoplasma]|uniref:hypothetical protein n=1 Tax=Italian clover phyllody phytoplasma TaxID=1196420 RepID=UPI0002ECE709|nr:hypothetical protein [Italian clover phyllody phytoplasma]
MVFNNKSLKREEKEVKKSGGFEMLAKEVKMFKISLIKKTIIRKTKGVTTKLINIIISAKFDMLFFRYFLQAPLF